MSEQHQGMPVSINQLCPRVQDLHQKMMVFIQEHVTPLETLHKKNNRQRDNKWEPWIELETVKAKARSEGLWNFFFSRKCDPEAKYGPGLSLHEYTFFCEEIEKYMFGSEVFNCSETDAGTMELLACHGSEAHRTQWLEPLLQGSIRSCFAVSEPEVASSDVSNIRATIRKEGDYYVINGSKTWIAGCLDTQCQVCIFLGRSSPAARTDKDTDYSLVLIPMNTAGVTVLRPLTVFGYDHYPKGYGQLLFKDVRVPVANILGRQGDGLAIVQENLATRRIHHCTHLLGLAERALALMVDRTTHRFAFGKLLSEQGSIQEDVARSRVQIEQCRLLVLKASYMMDLYGHKAAAKDIAVMKVATPDMAISVIDRSIQAHGAAGLSDDLPLAYMFSFARALRFGGGPDQIHLITLARKEFAKAKTSKL